MDRREFIGTLAGAMIAAMRGVAAQQPEKVARIGFLGAGSVDATYTRAGLMHSGRACDFGYIEGRNIVIEFRWAEGNYDRLPELAAELVRLNVDVLVSQGTPATLAAKGATTTIPIVMATGGDAVGTGLVASLARPGGNVTARLYLPRSSVPSASRCSRTPFRVPS